MNLAKLVEFGELLKFAKHANLSKLVKDAKFTKLFTNLGKLARLQVLRS